MCQALFIVLLLGWLFVPVYLTAGVSSSGCQRQHVSTSVSSTDASSYRDMHCVKCAVSGDHDAPVPEEEVRGDQDQPLPLRHLSVPLHFHQDLSESSCLGNTQSEKPSLCVSHPACLSLSPCRWTCFQELCSSSRH